MSERPVQDGIEFMERVEKDIQELCGIPQEWTKPGPALTGTAVYARERQHREGPQNYMLFFESVMVHNRFPDSVTTA